MEIKQYRGLETIGKRLGCHSLTVLKKIKRDGFLAYKEHTGIGARHVWVTDDRLIEIWQVAQCKASQERLLTRAGVSAKTGQVGQKQCPAAPKGTALHESRSANPDPVKACG